MLDEIQANFFEQITFLKSYPFNEIHQKIMYFIVFSCDNSSVGGNISLSVGQYVCLSATNKFEKHNAAKMF